MNETLLERFVRYTKINTRSYEKNETLPSSKEQEEFLFMLEKELKDIQKMV